MENYLLKYLDAETLFYPPNEPQPITVPGFKRRQLAEMFGALGSKTGAEIGVAAAKYSEVICQNVPGLKLLCIDPWVKQFDDPIHRKNHNNHYISATKRLKNYDAAMIRARSMDAVRDVPFESLDFVYIDSNHVFDAVMVDIIEWSKRVKPGGIVSGHDYNDFENFGIIKAVDTYTEVHNIKQWFLTNERVKSWFWRKGHD